MIRATSSRVVACFATLGHPPLGAATVEPATPRRSTPRLAALVTLGLALVVAPLALAGDAAACVCASTPLEERLDDADAAVVARLVDVKEGLSFPARRVLTFDVEQRVKGDVSGTIDVRSPSGTDCDLDLREGEVVGLLLTQEPADPGWFATACSVVDPGALVAEGGEPRGGALKVAVGIVILGLVLALAFYRLRRGSRPRLPGAPEP